MCLPQLEKDHAHCYTVCFHLCDERTWVFEGFFSSRGDMREERTQDVRRPLRKTFIYLVPSLIYLPPPRLFAWLAAELTDCLDGWLPLSLDSHWHFTHTLRELHWGWGGERQSGCSGFGKWDLCWISLSVCFGGLLDESRGNLWLSLLQHWPLTITTVLHPWLYIPGWCMGLDLSWFGHSAWHRVSRMYLGIEMHEEFAVHRDILYEQSVCVCVCARACARVDLYVTDKTKCAEH